MLINAVWFDFNLLEKNNMKLTSRNACNIKLYANPHLACKKTGLAWWRSIDEPMVSPGIRNTRINKGLTSKLDPAFACMHRFVSFVLIRTPTTKATIGRIFSKPFQRAHTRRRQYIFRIIVENAKTVHQSVTWRYAHLHQSCDNLITSEKWKTPKGRLLMNSYPFLSLQYSFRGYNGSQG